MLSADERGREQAREDRLTRQPIFQETLKYLNEFSVEFLSQTASRNSDRWKMAARQREVANPSLLKPSLTLYIEEMDCLRMVKYLSVLHGKDFAMLNFANSTHPGGGVWTGAGAQEENIFRRSSCWLSIQPRHLRPGSRDYSEKCRDLIDGANGTVYIDTRKKRVCFRDREDHTLPQLGYEYIPLTEIFEFIELRAAAVNLGQAAMRTKYANTFERECTKRIYAQFKTLVDQGIRHVVLGAFGCGAFQNDPETVARVYMRALNEYRTHFDVIAFPIIMSDDNLRAFRKVAHDFAYSPTSLRDELRKHRMDESVAVHVQPLTDWVVSCKKAVALSQRQSGPTSGGNGGSGPSVASGGSGASGNTRKKDVSGGSGASGVVKRARQTDDDDQEGGQPIRPHIQSPRGVAGGVGGTALPSASTRPSRGAAGGVGGTALPSASTRPSGGVAGGVGGTALPGASTRPSGGAAGGVGGTALPGASTRPSGGAAGGVGGTALPSASIQMPITAIPNQYQRLVPIPGWIPNQYHIPCPLVDVPLQWLSTRQRTVIQEKNLTVLKKYTDKLPCWVPASEIAIAFNFSQDGIMKALTHLQGKPFVWATEFEIRRESWIFDEQAVVINGRSYLSTQHYFEHQQVNCIKTHGQRYWDSCKELIMKQALETRFKNLSLKELLIATHPHELFCIKEDTFFGWSPVNGGQNILGTLLMQLRLTLVNQARRDARDARVTQAMGPMQVRYPIPQ